MHTHDSFRTEVQTAQNVTALKPSDSIFFIGSCFADNISQKLSNGLMDCWSNPYGAVYNPISVAQQIERISLCDKVQTDEITQSGNYHVSYMANSKLRASSKEELKQTINKLTQESNIILRQAAIISVTFGTAWIYKRCDNSTIVANCHKMPASTFIRQRLTADEIAARWSDTIATLRSANPNAHIIFTVSPIRHIKDTLHGNQISKAILIDATDRIVSETPNCSYFESYEIMMDDLRDYRFYADDMIHPSPTAINYIYDRFAEAYLAPETRQMIMDGNKITQLSQHRPINGTTAPQEHIQQILDKTDGFRRKYDLPEGGRKIKQLIESLNIIK